MGVCNPTNVRIIYYTSSKLVNFLEVSDAPTQVINIFYLTVNLKFLNIRFQIFLHFIPEMSTSFTSYVVQIFFVLNSVSTAFYPASFDPKNLNILHQNMVYVASILADLDYL